MKVKTLIILTLITFVIVAVSCKKEELPDTIKGRVIDKSDDQGVPYALVNLFNISSNTGSFTSSSVLVEEFTTDENGFFEFKRDVDATRACAGKENLYYSNCSNPTYIYSDKDESLEIVIYPEAYVTFEIIDTDKKNNNIDYIKLYTPFSGEGVFQASYLHPESNTTVSGTLLGGQLYTIYYEIHATDGNILDRTVEFTPIKFENPVFYIEY